MSDSRSRPLGPDLRVGMVGYGFMGAAHSQAWRTVNHFFDLPLEVKMAAVCGRNQASVSVAAAKLGWDSYVTDWRDLIARDDIDVIDICTPGESHAEITLTALQAGKHVLCEKPLANTVDEARTMVDAAQAATGVAMCGFNNRRVPAVALMRQMVLEGRVGAVRQVRATYLQDWIVDPEFPLVWRLQSDKAGSGALGDIGSHLVDLTQHVTGQRITGVSALTETFIKQRPLSGASTGLAATAQSGMGEVTVDDAVLFIARLDGGAVATYEASRFATGHKNGLRVEINGSLGSLAFDLERFNELEYYDRAAGQPGFSRVLVTEASHPYMSAWWPPGHMIGWEHSFTHQARDFIAAIASGTAPSPSFAEALEVQLVLDAVQRSAESGTWTEVE